MYYPGSKGRVSTTLARVTCVRPLDVTSEVLCGTLAGINRANVALLILWVTDRSSMAEVWGTMALRSDYANGDKLFR